ncbi:MAG: hypothetical protein E6R03_04935 [Hyphomicrobiaceae bacterium]|nr:MAG: hypothetical protein E6R03_04935 [Hyphomicrobiaceae bacterium]
MGRSSKASTLQEEEAEVPRELLPWLSVGGPSPGGEWAMVCPDPKHNDHDPSASLNLEKGVWCCFGCDRTSSIEELILEIKRRGLKPPSARPNISGSALVMDVEPEVVEEFVRALKKNGAAVERIVALRGVTKKTLSMFQIGWDTSQKAYSIPIYNVDGELLNIRFYDPTPGNRRKIWSVAGHGSAVLYPIHVIDDSKRILVCEGEWDALLANQHGLPAVTRTGAAKVWSDDWSKMLKGKEVVICHDMDTAGQEANKKIYDSVRRFVDNVRIVKLPYPVTADHGKDITDYLYHDKGAIDLFFGDHERPQVVSVLDSLAGMVGKTLQMEVTVTGRVTTTHLVPRKILMSCDGNYDKCDMCSMGSAHGGVVTIPPHDPIVLDFMGRSKDQRDSMVKAYTGIPMKCPRVEISAEEQFPVEELFCRPSIEQDSAVYGTYVNRKIVVVDRHSDMPNSTIQVVGGVFPSPKDGKNEFMAWEAKPTITSIDNFHMDAEMRERLDVFSSQDPMGKCMEIAEDLSDNVTEIYGRNVMHVFMDLVMHSALAFPFGNRIEHRGWIDGIIVGDTRTGKSEAALRLIEHYGLGQFVSCESATFAGVVGGLEQMGGKEWVVRWGVIPLNDRRAVVLDEVSGLRPEQIGQMSSIRSSGVAQLTKIQSESTPARTRLLWLGNPRPQPGRLANTLDQFSHGVMALLPLIGTAEDVARFDMAMCVRNDEVSSEVINAVRRSRAPHVYEAEMCHDLLRWVWTRTDRDVVWRAGAEEAAMAAATALGAKYVPAPPLVQAANARIKIARIAVAFAARTFSTDKSGLKIVVTKTHVQAAVDFLHMIYDAPAFGYLTMSRMARQEEITDDSVEDTGFELNPPTLALMNKQGGFTLDQFTIATGFDISQARGVLSYMVGLGFVASTDNGFGCTEPGFRWIRDRLERS